MCGRQQKISQNGAEYGWASTVFCTTENFWPPEVFEKAASIGTEKAEDAITARIYQLNPNADGKRIVKFIRG